ncbi:hypothetical protein GWK47_027588 [Chionoecetes opilio]|uniref:Uncharacterized protein n=1 Tax=Chionoecetes opilio TaxID=41210 RepID=A0A8J8WDA9_CHIOP|nr:hypothetical protein GWK47_027588 [Chionoecetes opilio]
MCLGKITGVLKQGDYFRSHTVSMMFFIFNKDNKIPLPSENRRTGGGQFGLVMKEIYEEVKASCPLRPSNLAVGQPSTSLFGGCFLEKAPDLEVFGVCVGEALLHRSSTGSGCPRNQQATHRSGAQNKTRVSPASNSTPRMEMISEGEVIALKPYVGAGRLAMSCLREISRAWVLSEARLTCHRLLQVTMLSNARVYAAHRVLPVTSVAGEGKGAVIS